MLVMSSCSDGKSNKHLYVLLVTPYNMIALKLTQLAHNFYGILRIKVSIVQRF